MGYAAIPYVLSAMGTAVSAYGQYAQGQQQSAMADYNAKLAERDARISKQNAEYAASQKRRETQRLLGRQRALYGAAGVTMEGSPLIMQEETAAEGEMDALMIERGYAIQAQKYESERNIYKMKGSVAQRSGMWGTGTTLLTGATQMYGYGR